MKYLILFVLVSALSSGCQLDPCGESPEKFVDRYEAFVEDLDDQKLEFDDKAWKRYDAEFEQYFKDCYPKFEDDLSRKEERRFGQATARYYMIKYGKGLKYQYGDDVEELAERLEQGIEKFAEEYGDDFEKLITDFFEDNEDNIEQLSDDLRNAFERFSDGIDEDEVEEMLDSFRKLVEGVESDIKKK